MPYLATYQTKTRRMIGVLQQWQVLLSPRHEQAAVVTLADVEAVTAALQETFGALTPARSHYPAVSRGGLARADRPQTSGSIGSSLCRRLRGMRAMRLSSCTLVAIGTLHTVSLMCTLDLRRLDRLMRKPHRLLVRNIVGQHETSIDFRRVIENKEVIL